jgi:hypothetical protein
MAELKNYVMAVLAIVFVSVVSVSIYSSALTNNLASGGSGTNMSFALLNQSAAYQEQMQNFSKDFSKSTSQAASTQTTGWDTLSGGIGMITQAGTGAISLTLGSMGVLITMLGSLADMSALGIPPVVSTFGIIFVTLSIVFAVLAAVFKWWL